MFAENLKKSGRDGTVLATDVDVISDEKYKRCINLNNEYSANQIFQIDSPKYPISGRP